MAPMPRGRGAGGTLAMRGQGSVAQQLAAGRASGGSGAAAPALAAPPPQPDVVYNATNWKNNFQVVYYL
jgi:hypothetical protein